MTYIISITERGEKMSETEIKGNEKNTEGNGSKSRHRHSESSHSHRHSHHSGSSHSHHSGSSHSHRSESSNRYRDSEKKEQNENFSAEYSKHKKIRLWWRSSFIAVICLALLVLVVLIANSGKNQDSIFIKKYSPSSDVGKLQSELAEVKAENVRLKYELDKYIDMYGELGVEEEEEEPEVHVEGTVKK